MPLDYICANAQKNAAKFNAGTRHYTLTTSIIAPDGYTTIVIEIQFDYTLENAASCERLDAQSIPTECDTPESVDIIDITETFQQYRDNSTSSHVRTRRRYEFDNEQWYGLEQACATHGRKMQSA